MNLHQLQLQILELAFLEEGDEPVVHCYLGTETEYRKALHDRVHAIKATIEPAARKSFWETIGRIEVFVGTHLHAGTKGGVGCLLRYLRPEMDDMPAA